MTEPITNPPHPYPREIAPLRFRLEFTLDPARYLADCEFFEEEPSFDAWLDWAIEEAEEYLQSTGPLYSKRPWCIRDSLAPVEPVPQQEPSLYSMDPTFSALQEDIIKAIDSLEFAVRDLRSALNRCHGPLSVAGMPLEGLLKTTCTNVHKAKRLRQLLAEQEAAKD